MTAFFARLRASLRGGAHDRDLVDELDAHYEMLVEDNLRRGLAPDAARRAARLRLGNPASLREQHRGQRGLPALDGILQDAWFACRVLRRGRRFSAAAVVALALGIGANTVGFTIVYGALVRALPFDAADDLYVISWSLKSGRRGNPSVADFEQWQASTRTFEALAGYTSAVVNLSDDRQLPEQVAATYVTPNAFGVLRQRPLLGRDFTAGDAASGADPVAIVGARVWRARYGGDAAVLGRVVRVNGRSVAIVGVMPDGMAFPESTEIWMPFVPSAAQRAGTARVLRVFGRLGATTPAAAAAEFAAIAAGMIAARPDVLRDVSGARVETFQRRYIGGAGRPMFITVLGAVSFVLLIACANVANLLLSRGAERAREIAVRAALGASRGRIVRQLLIESLVLAAVGGAGGLLLSAIALPMFSSQIAASLPYWVRFELDGLVFGYVTGVCLVTTVIFGLAPALQLSKTSSSDVLKDGGRGATAGRRTRRFSGAIVVAQIALTMTLLVGAGVLVRSFATLYFIDLGIPIDGLVTMRVQLPASKYASLEARREFFDRLAPRLAAIPGVDAAAITTGVPPLDGGERYVEIEGRGPSSPTMVGTVTITPEFFAVVQAPLRFGRAFDATDGAPGAAHVIVNEHFARRFLGDDDPIGQRIRFTVREPAGAAPVDAWRTIVGVSRDIGQGSSLDRYVNAVVYLPYRQEAPGAASLLLRSRLPPAAIMAAVRHVVRTLDPDQPVHSLQTVADVLAGDRWWQRTWGSVFGIVAAIALALSSVGLYAVMSYAVAQRTQEIGVRMAVGAARAQIVWLVLRRGLVQVAWGLAIGAGASMVLARVMPGGLEGVSAYDPAALAVTAALLIVVSIAACVLPARRATRVDPVVALRAE